jgi:hypothetical protein
VEQPPSKWADRPVWALLTVGCSVGRDRPPGDPRQILQRDRASTAGTARSSTTEWGVGSGRTDWG